MPAPAPPHILIVDDDEYVHAAIVAALRPLRADVSRAATAAEALVLTRNQLPDLAIVDLGLPDADGFELTRLLRSEPNLRGLRIVIVTGYVPDEDAARNAGADLIIGKPFRLHDFLEMVTGQLQLGATPDWRARREAAIRPPARRSTAPDGQPPLVDDFVVDPVP